MINQQSLIKFEELIAQGKGKEFLDQLSKSINIEDTEIKKKYDKLVNQWNKNQASKKFGYLDERQSIYSFQSVFKRNKDWINNSLKESLPKAKNEEETIITDPKVSNIKQNESIIRRKSIVGILFVIGGLLLFAPYFYPSSITKVNLVGNKMILTQPNLIDTLWDAGRLIAGILNVVIGIWNFIVPYGKITKNTLEINDVFSKKIIQLSDIIKVNNQLYYKRKKKPNKKLIIRQVKKCDVNKLHETVV